MDELLGMGFSDEQCSNALDASGGDVALAIDILVSNFGGGGGGGSGGGSASGRHADSGSSFSGGAVPGTWACPVCTLVNMDEDPMCSACGEPSPRAPKVAVTAAPPKPTPTKGTRKPTPAVTTPPSTRTPPPTSGPVAKPAPAKVAAAQACLDDAAPTELRPKLARISDFLLSPAASTDKTATKLPSVPRMSEAEIMRMIRASIQGVDSTLDRTHTNPVLQLICSTYQYGLPTFNSQPAIQQHVITSMQFVLGSCKVISEKARKRHLTKLIDSFTSCQAEQVRVIDSIFGELSGRDKGFREQVLSLVDEQKQRVLDQVTNLLNPNAWRQDDGTPTEQVAHLQSSYRKVIGPRLGLRCVDAAATDRNAPALSHDDETAAEQLFRKLFSVAELAHTLADDVNQQKPDADRVINRDALAKWVGETTAKTAKPKSTGSSAAATATFDPNLIYWDEDRAKEWDEGVRPNPENEYQPFLSVKIAVDLLHLLFLRN
ncbi:hypothetical protein Pelo_11490 [Pelomyxa schiedti]|nr:hypothetical protein Pelo_11490 [Pelomyxa schiedti]